VKETRVDRTRPVAVAAPSHRRERGEVFVMDQKPAEELEDELDGLLPEFAENSRRT
jgi:hypothetical protein